MGSSTHVNVNARLSEDPREGILLGQVAEELLSPTVPLDAVKGLVGLQGPLAAQLHNVAQPDRAGRYEGHVFQGGHVCGQLELVY